MRRLGDRHFAPRHRRPIHLSCATMLTNLRFTGLVCFLFLCQPYISYNSSSLPVLDLVYDSAPSCHTTGTHNGPRVLAPRLLGTIRRLPTDLVCLPTTRDVRPALLLTLPRQARVRQYRVRNRLPSGTSLRVRKTTLGASLSQPSPRPANSPCRKRGIQNAGRPTGNTG